MDTIEDKLLDDLLAPADGSEITLEHRAWMNEQIKKRMAKIEAGTAEFVSLQDAKRQLGFDAY